MKSHLVTAIFAEIKFLEDDVIVGGKTYLNTGALQFQQDVHQDTEQFWIQVGLRLIPKQDGTFLQRVVSDQQLQQRQLARSFGEQRKFEMPLFSTQKKFLIPDRDLSVDGLLQNDEQTIVQSVRRTA